MADPYYVMVYTLAYIGLFAASFYIISLLTFYRKKVDPPEDTSKTVSILVPAYNERASIEKTLKSLLALNYPRKNYEIIVVDDGSKDDTYKIAKKFASDKHPKVKVFTKPNGGKSSAMNLGLKQAQGEIVFSMDADSFVFPDSLKKMTRYFANKNVMAVTPAMGVYKPKSIWQRIQHIEYYMGVFLRKSFATMNAIHITPGAFSGYRKSFFDKYGGYDEKNITEDLEVALRIQSHDGIIENAEKAVIYTLGPRTFKELLVQRRRWYTGLINNLWAYRKKLFGPKKGAMGVIVLPVAVTTVTLSVLLTVYTFVKGILKIRDNLQAFSSVNFQFDNILEFNLFILQTFVLRIFSSKIFLLSALFLTLLWFYLAFARKKTQFKESLKFSFILFITMYSLLFAFWWIISAFYVAFNKKVIWREENKK
ncbi:MAG: glycosyltransferase [Nanoarchaeota archaeon]